MEEDSAEHHLTALWLAGLHGLDCFRGGFECNHSICWGGAFRYFAQQSACAAPTLKLRPGVQPLGANPGERPRGRPLFCDTWLGQWLARGPNLLKTGQAEATKLSRTLQICSQSRRNSRPNCLAEWQAARSMRRNLAVLKLSTGWEGCCHMFTNHPPQHDKHVAHV